MKPEDADRLEQIRRRALCDNCGIAKCTQCFLLRVIEERGKEIESKDFGLNNIIIMAGHEKDHPEHERLSEIQTAAKLARKGATKADHLKAAFPGLDPKVVLGKDPA